MNMFNEYVDVDVDVDVYVYVYVDVVRYTQALAAYAVTTIDIIKNNPTYHETAKVLIIGMKEKDEERQKDRGR